jgi:hypothetical protein
MMGGKEWGGPGRGLPDAGLPETTLHKACDVPSISQHALAHQSQKGQVPW